MHYATGLGGAVLSAAAIVWAFLDADSPLRMPVTGALLGSTSAVATVSLLYWRGLSLRKAKDQRALKEVSTLLRETVRDVLESEQLSSVQRELFRIRLRRLDITPGEGAPRRSLFSNLLPW
jgi:hypothetical protein